MENKDIFAIWICKEGTCMMPFLYEVCIASWQIKNPGYRVIIYSNNPEIKFNLLSRDTTEVIFIQDVFPGLLEKAEEIIGDAPSGMKFAHISDYIRYFILSQCGGIYIDCDLYCIKGINDLLVGLYNEEKSVLLAYEDTMRICNAFLGCLDNYGKQFYADIITNYNNRYVPTSYTFNSIKYPMILARRYRKLIYVLSFKEGMFYPNWEKNDNGNLEILKTKDCELKGYGVHLYNTDVKWKELRIMLEDNLYTDNLDWWILRDMNRIMDAYMDIMVQSPIRDIKNDVVYNSNLTELYGEGYVDNLMKAGEQDGE